MNVKRLEVGHLRENCFLVSEKETEECLIIDPGDDADYIQRVLGDNDLKPVKIVATHGHFDHIMAAYELQTALKIPFAMHKKDRFLLSRMRSSAEMFTGAMDVSLPPKVDINVKEGDKIVLGKLTFKVIETPGHTPGSISLVCKEERIVFVGDLIFESGLGRTDFEYSSEIEMEKSLERIKKYSGYQAYSGHGEEFII